MDSIVEDKLVTVNDLLSKQIKFQKLLGNDIPVDTVTFDNVKMALEHNIYQQIEFQEFMEANNYEKKEELVDWLLFMLNKYIYLGIKGTSGTLFDELWCSQSCPSSSLASSYAEIEQANFIKLIRTDCIFKPWKVRENENCADISAVYNALIISLDCFKSLARMTFDSYYDLYSCIVKKLMINIDRQNNNY